MDLNRWILKTDPVHQAQSIETHRSKRDQNQSRPGNGSKAIAPLFTEANRLKRMPEKYLEPFAKYQQSQEQGAEVPCL
jgi:hypothetical protein